MTATGDTAPHCRTDARRAAVRAEPALNGVDGVEVGDDGRTLTVTFLGKAPHGLGPENVRIDGGRRVTGIEALEVVVEREDDPELDDRLLVTVDRTGDTTAYRLSLVATDPYGRPGTEPYPGFDQRYHSAGFTFRLDCPRPLDCGGERPAPPPAEPSPLADYTARDYPTLRRLLLDRLALTTPGWTGRHVPDLGTTLVELLAHTADRIGYQQDAVATEAYLGTARHRVSVRRHVRLVDYPMHDGCNARVLVTLDTPAPLTLPPGRYRFAAVDTRGLPAGDRPRAGTVLDDEDLAVLAERGAVEVFEPLTGEAVELHPAHGAIRFWTWGGEQCVLPAGATAATLRDEWADEERAERLLRLRPGDLLVFEEVRGPRSGTRGDADPAHRQAVRLVSVTPAVDALAGQPVLEITWDPADAPAFPLCLSTLGGPDCEPVPDVSIARGNVVAADHGRTLTFHGGPPELLAVPPEPAVPPSCAPPAFGCPGSDTGNPPARLIGSLLRGARAGRRLTPGDLRELHRVVGAAACERAGISAERAGRHGERVVPGTAGEQADALGTLLAQSAYPGLAPRFRPVLREAPVTQAVAHPRPELVARGQAERLAAVPARVRRRLAELWRSARDRDGLTDEEIAELAVLFGPRVLERVALRRHPVRALRELLYHSERLLAAKLRRLAVLTARARAGTVLGPAVAWEIAQSWGPPYAAGLRPDEPELHGPAAALLAPDPRAALPAVRLTERSAPAGADPADEAAAADAAAAPGPEGAGPGGGRPRRPAVWEPRRDLLDSGPRDRHFTGELTDDGRLALRFGDGRHGARPAPGALLAARYRVGGGTAGNVGAEAVNHLVLRRDPESRAAGDTPPVAGVRNPLPATGGTGPEPVEHVRRLAPLDLGRTRLRAVTAADYAALAGRVPGVQRAAAELRWTGSVREAQVAVDPLGTAEPAPDLLDAVAHVLERYRRIGHDVIVRPAEHVPLDIAVEVCARPGHQHGRIAADLHRVLGTRALPGGRLGFFHPDVRTFGEPVRLSRLVAVAAAVAGVESVRVTRLRRLFHGDAGELEDGVLRLGPLEIARCDNDPERPENGRLDLTLTGGAR